MTISSNQPYFMPYLPYWQLIDCADLFLVGDDFSYRKSSWIPRNRILVNGRVQFFRIELRHQSSNTLIRDMEIVPPDLSVKLRTLEMAYHKAPCFAEGYALCERVLRFPSGNLCEFLTASIKEVCKYMYIDTPIGFTSDVPGNSEFRNKERIYHLCKYYGADTYVNATGGQALYDYDGFRSHGLRLAFLRTEIPAYKQLSDRFVPGLSVMDAVMFLSREQLRDMLDKRSFIYG